MESGNDIFIPTWGIGVPLSVLSSIPDMGSTSNRFARLSSWKNPGFALKWGTSS